MKNILFALAVIYGSSTFANEIVATDDMDTELKSYIQVSSGSKEYKWKSTTKCVLKTTGKDAVYSHAAAVTYYICPDKTISHIQPNSTGVNGWEGYCGQTAISNVTSMLCNRHMSPKSNDYYGTDYGPGEHSSTMKKILNTVFSEHVLKNTCPQKVTWSKRQHWYSSTFLRSLRGDLFGSTHKIRRYRSSNTYVKVTPTPVLLNSGGLNYHWVTVVDIIKNDKDPNGCDVVLNTWGDQKTLTCENFLSYADHSSIGERVHLGFD